MTTKEFSNEFDIHYNSIATNSAPGLDSYEKSVYLTKAQLEIIKNYFNPNGNKYKQGFEQNSKRRNDLKGVVKHYNGLPYGNSGYTSNSISRGSQFFDIPSKVFLIVEEEARSLDSRLCTKSLLNFNKYNRDIGDKLSRRVLIIENILKDSASLDIIPKTHDEYLVQKDSPFKRPDKKKAWRIDYNFSNFESTTKNIELISEFKLDLYRCRYIEYPDPIILEDLNILFPNENLSIDGINTAQTCKLAESIHREILDRAVELASLDYKPDQSLQLRTQINQRNE